MIRVSDDVLTALVLLLMTVAAGFLFWYAITPPELASVHTELASGDHLTIVFVAPTSSGDGELTRAVQGAKAAAKAWADEHQYLFGTIGVSDHWSVREGLSLLSEFGDFDEVIVGRNWFNLGVTEFISRRHARPSIPQLLIQLQRVKVDTVPFEYTAPIEVVRRVGGSEILDWARGGYVMPAPTLPVPHEDGSN